MRDTLPALLLFLSLLGFGCEVGKKQSSEQGHRKEEETPAAPLEAHLEATSEDFGPWDGEAFSAAADRQLKLLGRFLTGAEAEPPFPGAITHGLSGFKLQALGRSESFAMRRAEIAKGEQMILPEAMARLRRHFDPDGITLAEIKIVRVTLAEGKASSELHVHLASKRHQINSVWHAEWSVAEKPILTSIEAHSYEECERTGPGRMEDSSGFVLGHVGPEVAQFAHGMDHWVARIEMLFEIEVSAWHGIAVADVNGDGLEDVYLPDGGGLPNRLLVQQSDGSVRDHSRQAGLDYLDHSFGALFADFDNDGDQDAAISTVHGVLLLANDGQGKFSPRAGKLFPAAIPYSLAAADYDEDGDLDLFACSYVPRGGSRRHSFIARPVPYHDAVNGGRNELLRNEGDFHFRTVTKAAGLAAGNSKFSYSASWEDYDGDGDLDLYVANDFGANHLYRNGLRESGRPVFEEVAAASGVRDVAAGMSACWGDYDNDGHPDLYVGNMFSSAGNRIAFQDLFRAGQDDESRALYQRHARGNSLFRNKGDGTFEDRSLVSGASMGRWAWSSLFADLDNDGWEDLLVANGFITQANPDDL